MDENEGGKLVRINKKLEEILNDLKTIDEKGGLFYVDREDHLGSGCFYIELAIVKIKEVIRIIREV